MNTYAKYCPNVFLAKCEEQYQKGDIITVTTKYGKERFAYMRSGTCRMLKFSTNVSVPFLIYAVSTSTFRFTLPLEMIWQPKEDITTYELAMCLPYFFRHRAIIPYEIDKSLPHFRHFKIIDHNAQ